jgi:hypothetical protein
MGKIRNSYSSQKKLEIIANAEEYGNRFAARYYGVDEKQIRSWRKSKEILLLQRPSRFSNRGRNAVWPELEVELKNWILAERRKGFQLSPASIGKKALIIAEVMNINSDNKFKASCCWCHNFMKRNGLTTRARTSVGQKLPEDWEAKKTEFLRFCTDKIAGIEKKHIGNMDEVPVSFDMPSNHTVDQIGTKTVRITTTRNEKANFTAMLCITADGGKLPPLVIFKRKTFPRKEIFPTGIIVKVNPKGWVDSNIMLEWIDEVWRRRPHSFFTSASLLIVDSAKAHLTEEVKTKFRSSSRLAVIPGGLTKILQPLDLTVNRSFKSKLRHRWNRWIADASHTFTPSGAMKRVSLGEICIWIKESWDEVSVDCVQNGFYTAHILPQTGFPSSNSQMVEPIDHFELDLRSSEPDESFDGFE